MQKTGDKIIVLPEENGDAFVIMPFEAYEAIAADYTERPANVMPNQPVEESQKPQQKTVWDTLAKPESVPLPPENSGSGQFPESDQEFYLEPIE